LRFGFCDLTMLYIIATPIGNLEDITLRALRILKEVDYVLCEDTRVTRKLLDHYNIKNKKLISYHQHSSQRKVNQLIRLIRDYSLALVTDAGTPGISDPGNKLINQLINEPVNQSMNQGEKKVDRSTYSLVNIVPIPGPSALTAALSVSGLPTDRFLFLGFVPHKKGRQKFLREVLESKRTVVFYESSHRILKTLSALKELGNCHPELGSGSHRIPKQVRNEKRLVVCRELTKKFETIYRGSAAEVLEQIKKDFPNGNPKGEFVVVAG